MRDYILGWELQRAGMDWRGWLLARWGLTGARRLVAQLKADPSLGSEAERVRAFIERGGGCRATYYNQARKLRPPVAPPKIRLHRRPPGRAVLDQSLLDLLRRRFAGMSTSIPAGATAPGIFGRQAEPSSI